MSLLQRFAQASALLTAVGLGACGGGAPVRQTADQAALSACQQRADEIYSKQNRDEVYRTDTFTTSGLDAPFSSSTVPDLTTRGLSGQYERDNLVSDCLAGTGAATGPSGKPAVPVPPENPPPAGSGPP